MEVQALALAAVSVAAIADHRVTERRRVDADLVRATGVERGLEQRSARARMLGLHAPEGGARRLGPRLARGGDAHALGTRQRDERRLAHELRLRVALDEHAIRALDLVLDELLVEALVRDVADREQHEPR